MRIAHVALADHYTDGMTYQDNQLAEQNVRDGHEVLVVSDDAKFVDGELVRVGNEDTFLECGVHLIRLPYVHVVNEFISDKFRKVQGLYKILEEFKPDVILAHGMAYYSLLDVVKYKKNHMHVKLYADIHADGINSGRNWLSLHILHGLFYRFLIQGAVKYLEKYFYIGPSNKEFAMKVYGVPEELMEFLPLGAKVFGEEEYQLKREKKRRELALQEGELLLIHSGKLDELKKTDVLLRAFGKVRELRAKLVIIGSMSESIRDTLNNLIDQDRRVIFAGWKTGEELLEYLCACDLYCQPGSYSATLQNAVGCHCPVLCYPHDLYLEVDKGNFIWVREEDDIVESFKKIETGEIQLSELAERAQACASKFLDYRELVKAIYR